jgi:hypothetical protein
MKKILVCSAIALAMSGAANAASISFSDSFGLADTNWSQALNLSRFDSSLGTLTSVIFSYGGQVDSAIRFESLDAAPATVSGNTSGNLIFDDPIFDTLNIASSQSQAVGAFDGAIDFGGTSGFDFGTITGTASDSLTLISGFAPYTGLGTFAINVDATGLSNVSGAGNLVSVINTQARADITVTYNYDEAPPPPPPVPEPAVLGLIGLGLAGLGFRKKSQG